jgi:hypothetical protein
MSVSQDQFAAIAALDLEPIMVKLMHVESGEGWSLERARAVEFEYRRFLYLMKKYPEELAAPSFDVDTFWHYHILDTMKYAEDCQNVFGHFLHHFPYIGLRGEDDLLVHESAGERMRCLYEDTFAETYPYAVANEEAGSLVAAANTKSDTAYSAKLVGTAYSAKLADTAYSAKLAGTAYSAKLAGTAYSAKPAGTAYSAKLIGAAYSAKLAGVAVDSLAAIRPRLADMAA